MKRLKRISIKISFTTILFFLISLVSLTFAWFCYSSVANANMELEVLAWNIDYAGDQTTINVQVDDVKPGMDEYSRDIDVTNNGDVDAKLSYKIKKIRVFDDEYTASTDSEMQEIIDSFPFDIDISITSSIVEKSHTEKCIITVNWDFEGNSSSVDTEWGKNSNEFYEQEKALHDEDSSYVIRKPLEIEMELISTQVEPD